jgi:peroxiredoxin
MLESGEQAPGFELPAVVDGEVARRSLSDYVGEDIVVLAFYPADFNPACDDESCDLGELDLFTMQKDVTILGISPDSVYSHRQFADCYDLNVPLLSDTRREVAEQYGVALEGNEGYLCERAVFVVDLHGGITYAWSTADPRELPNVEPIRAAIAEVGGDSTAVSRYKVGHAHYVEGRRAFTSAMNAYGDHEWMTAQKDFDRARAEFEEAAEEFDTALRFSDAGVLNGPFEQARLKANSLWQAADWLADSASAYSSGNGSVGEEYRDDAETPLTSARAMDEPIDPDDITVEGGEVALETGEESIMQEIRDDEGEAAAAGGVDLDVDRVEPETDDEAESDDDGPSAETDAARRAREYGGEGVDLEDVEGAQDDQIADAVDEVDPGGGSATVDNRAPDIEVGTESEAENVPDDEDVTDDEVAEIAAELEQQQEEIGSEGDDAEDAAEVTDDEVTEIAAELDAQDEES